MQFSINKLHDHKNGRLVQDIIGVVERRSNEA